MSLYHISVIQVRFCARKRERIKVISYVIIKECTHCVYSIQYIHQELIIIDCLINLINLIIISIDLYRR